MSGKVSTFRDEIFQTIVGQPLIQYQWCLRKHRFTGFYGTLQFLTKGQETYNSGRISKENLRFDSIKKLWNPSTKNVYNAGSSLAISIHGCHYIIQGSSKNGFQRIFYIKSQNFMGSRYLLHPY